MKSEKIQDKSKIFSLCSKRAQMKIQQMAFMLITITLFFILVGLFVLVWRFGGLRQSAELLEKENVMLLVTKLSDSPEFSCGTWDYKASCIDTDKVIMLKKSINKYSGFWGRNVSNIQIEKIYPKEPRIECNLNNYPDCNVISLLSKETTGVPRFTFVALCRKDLFQDKIYDKCELGRLLVFYD